MQAHLGLGRPGFAAARHHAPAQRPTASRLVAAGVAGGTKKNGASNGVPDVPANSRASSGTDGASSAKPTDAAAKQVLSLAFESDKQTLFTSAKNATESVVKTTGLHRAPLSGGVKTATTRWGTYCVHTCSVSKIRMRDAHANPAW